MVTSVVRDLHDSTLRTQLNSHSEAVGIETNLWWARRTWRFMGHLDYAQVAGDSQAILRLQRSSARYFHRPDRRQGSNGLFTNAYDPSLTTMRGYAGYGRLSKEGGNWLFEASTMVKSPGFEANDVAFNTQVDRVWMHANLLRQFTRPNRFARTMVFIAGGQQAYNYSGDLVDRQVQAYAEFTLLNYWDVGGFVMLNLPRDDDQATRGGPVVRRAGGFNSFYMLSTDSRKPVAFSTQPVFGCRDGTCWAGANATVTLRPASNISVSVGPYFSDDRTRSWYVASIPDPTASAMYGRRYVFGQLRQRTLELDTRLNVTFSPTLTLELFLQPLIASAGYSKFHEYDRPRSLQRTTYGVNGGSIAPVEGGYTVDPDGSGRQPRSSCPTRTSTTARSAATPWCGGSSGRLDAVPGVDPGARGRRAAQRLRPRARPARARGPEAHQRLPGEDELLAGAVGSHQPSAVGHQPSAISHRPSAEAPPG